MYTSVHDGLQILFTCFIKQYTGTYISHCVLTWLQVVCNMIQHYVDKVALYIPESVGELSTVSPFIVSLLLQ